MDLVLWLLQGLLALGFLVAGLPKLFQGKPGLLQNPRMGWVHYYSDAQVRLIGLAELLGALGLVLPWALQILPWLTPVAALALAVLMAGAVVVNLGRKKSFAPALAFAVLSLLVAVGRF